MKLRSKTIAGILTPTDGSTSEKLFSSRLGALKVSVVYTEIGVRGKFIRKEN